MIRFSMLGSGSRGNGTLVSVGTTTILVDCGFTLKDAELRLARLGIGGAQISAILVTHEHDDHLGGVGRFARRHGIPVWLTPGTHAVWRDHAGTSPRLFNPHETFSIGEIEVRPFPVPHDAREPCQYVFSDGACRLGVLSDAGAVTPHMRSMLDGCDGLLLEFNHDPEMLLRGPYPDSLKRRVGGSLGHLSNAQSSRLLESIDRSRLKHLALTHLSETNNTPEHALSMAAQALGGVPEWLTCAHQDLGLAWRQIT